MLIRLIQIRNRKCQGFIWGWGFPAVPMDDEHWTTELAPERTFCIHENGLPNNVCSYPCPYTSNNTVSYIDNLDLSDVSDLEDHFLTTSDEEELPGLEEVLY